MRQLFTGIRSDNPEVVIRGRMLKGATIIVAITLLITIPIIIALRTSTSNPLIIPLIVVDLVMCVFAFWLAHRGAVVGGGFLLCLTFIIVGVFIAGTGQSHQPLNGIISYNHMFPLLIAGMVIGSWAVPVFGLMPLVAFGILVLLGENTNAQISPTILLVMIGVLFWLIIRTLEGSLADARRQTKAAQLAQHDLLTQQQALLHVNNDLNAANDQMSGLLNLVRDLETPLIPVLDGVLILPLIGHIDTARATRISTSTMAAVHTQRTRMLLIDLTGMTMVDTAVIQWIDQLSSAVRLLGVRPMITGMRAEIAQIMALQHITLENVQSVSRLQEGIQLVLQSQATGIRG